MFEEFIQVELRARSCDAQEIYNMYFLGFILQSLHSERHLSDTWKDVLVSKCTWGQSFWVLYAICIESFCDRIFTAISHNIVLTISLGPERLFSFSKLSKPIFWLFLHRDRQAKISAMCDLCLNECYTSTTPMHYIHWNDNNPNINICQSHLFLYNWKGLQQSETQLHLWPNYIHWG